MQQQQIDCRYRYPELSVSFSVPFLQGWLLEEIWDVAGDFVNDNTLTVYIKRLRDKIEDNPAQPKIIVTVRGMGYKLGK